MCSAHFFKKYGDGSHSRDMYVISGLAAIPGKREASIKIGAIRKGICEKHTKIVEKRI